MFIITSHICVFPTAGLNCKRNMLERGTQTFRSLQLPTRKKEKRTISSKMEAQLQWRGVHHWRLGIGIGCHSSEFFLLIMLC